MSADPYEIDARVLGTRLVTNTLAQAGGTIGSALIGLATFLVLTRGLGPAAFGDFAAAQAFLFLPIVIADVGLTAGVLREISAAPENTERAMGALLPLSLIVSTAIVAALVAIGLMLPFSERTTIAIAIGSLGAFLTLLTLTLSPVLQARLQMHWGVVALIAGRIVALALILGAFALGLGFKSAVVATVIGIAVTFAVQLLAVARLVRLRPRVDVAYWRKLGSASFLLGAANALGQINFRIDTVLLALFRTSSEVGYYGAAYKFVELSHSVSGAVGISVFPPLARFARQDAERFRQLAQRSFDVLLAASVPAILVMVSFPHELLRWTAGAEFEPGAVALQLLAVFIPFSFVNHVVWRLLIAFRQDRALVAIAGTLVATTVLLNVILIPPYGMKAAALVTVGGEVLVVALAAAVLLRRHAVFPNLGYAAWVTVGSIPAAAVVLGAPGPRIVVALAAVGTYVAAIAVLPGTVRDLLRSFVLSRAAS